MFWKQTSLLSKLCVGSDQCFLGIYWYHCLWAASIVVEDQLICQQMSKLFCYLLLCPWPVSGPSSMLSLLPTISYISHFHKLYWHLPLIPSSLACKPIHKMSYLTKDYYIGLRTWVPANIMVLVFNRQKIFFEYIKIILFHRKRYKEVNILFAVPNFAKYESVFAIKWQQ